MMLDIHPCRLEGRQILQDALAGARRLPAVTGEGRDPQQAACPASRP
jgi:hypothetical protein